KVFGIRELERGDGIVVLGSHMQRLSTRDQYLEGRTGEQQLRDPGCGTHHLLEVVQQQQGLLLLQRAFHLFQRCVVTCFLETKRLADGGDDQVGVADGSQGNEKDAIEEVVTQRGGYLYAQAGLADATRTRQGEETYLWAREQLADLCHFLLTSEK